MKPASISARDPSGRVAGSRLVPALALALALAAPYLVSLSGSQFRLAVIVAIFAVLSMGLQVIWGFCGQPSFGHAALYGVGAYTVAILTVRLDLAAWPALALAPLLGIVAGLLIGLPALRVRADYLALVTFAGAEALRVVEQGSELTGGANGLPGVAPLTLGGETLVTPADLYYPAIVMLLVVYLLARALRTSAAGRAMLAVRGDELTARSLGIRPGPQKLLAFAIGGAFAGLAGGFYATFAGFVSSVSFDIIASFQIVVMVIIGGLGSLNGAIVGAAIVMGIDQQLQDDPEVRLLLTGLVMLVVVFWRGGAIAAGWSSVRVALSRRRRSPGAPPAEAAARSAHGDA